MSAKVVSLINLKGGVAKTTTTVQLAECLASQFSKNVLVIDLDPQTNATIALIGEDKWDELHRKKQTVFQMFKDKLDDTSDFQVQQAIQKGVSNLRLKTLSLLPSSIQLIDIQDNLKDISEKTEGTIATVEVLKHFIKPYLNNYDYVLIDCPPNLGNITKNGIEISDYFLIPTIPDKLSIYGVPQIIKSIHTFAGKRHLKIKCLGLVITKYQQGSTRHNEVKDYELPARFKESFTKLNLDPAPNFKTMIPQANKIAEAMDVETEQATFKQKYGHGNLNKYVIDMTKEFIQYAG
ncbi:AAA family ATPase [Sphaerospermopsis aphanizomenoides BCCUSP55]|uniref:ParA family protein n=1 Tax=Sphaerospermopsis aphanizomenoides TaxID=459663 RepID=UPI001902E7D4|nr:AAA family ATPase [Sphaerospermopsis aphanizomenoides]MBK1988415.1 AAA family ATPase [Sphaerospermopsis aphanizomenoides BCCUSP55]